MLVTEKTKKITGKNIKENINGKSISLSKIKGK